MKLIALSLVLSLGCDRTGWLPTLDLRAAARLSRASGADRNTRDVAAEAGLVLSWTLRAMGERASTGAGWLDVLSVPTSAPQSCAVDSLCDWEHSERRAAMQRLGDPLATGASQ